MKHSWFDEETSRRLEALYRSSDIVHQRREVLEMLALQPGEQVLDIGSGPGLLAGEMAEAIGRLGHVTGIDISDSMLALSQRRYADSAINERMTFLRGDATALPFRDESFDAVVSTQVYEYVDDTMTALLELHRVLKAGGRALILDTDWDSIVWNATDEARMDRLLKAWSKRFAHPHLPRVLSRRLQDAGFKILRRAVLVFWNSEYDRETYSVAHVDIMADFAVDHQGVTPEEVEAWKQDLRQLGQEGLYFFSLNRYLFLAIKP